MGKFDREGVDAFVERWTATRHHENAHEQNYIDHAQIHVLLLAVLDAAHTQYGDMCGCCGEKWYCKPHCPVKAAAEAGLGK